MKRIPSLHQENPFPRKVSTDLNNRRWKRFRRALLNKRIRKAVARDIAICVDCEIQGRQYSPQHVHAHHILPRAEFPGLVFDPHNIEFVCAQHHTLRNHVEAVPKIVGRYVVYGPDATKYAQELKTSSEKIISADQVPHTIRTPVWVVCEQPNQAYAIARKIGATVHRTTREAP